MAPLAPTLIAASLRRLLLFSVADCENSRLTLCSKGASQQQQYGVPTGSFPELPTSTERGSVLARPLPGWMFNSNVFGPARRCRAGARMW